MPSSRRRRPRAAVLVAIGLACVSCAACKGRNARTPAPAHPDIIVITVDTLRADRLGCYGFAPARTPHIDRLANEGVLVEHAVAPTPITLPSHASIFTGLYPPAHGVRDNGRYRVPDDVTTLAERLKSDGYQTQAFVSSMVLHRRFNLNQGFDGYDDQIRAEGDAKMFHFQERSGKRTMDRVLRWLGAAASSSPRTPLFLWVHLFDPHQPYEPPEEDAKRSPTLYDGEIASVDRQIGRFVDALKKRGSLDDTLLVFTSDHGESLGEHREATHALFIYESTVHVPLLLRYPKMLPAGTRYDASASSVDLVPTILALADLPPMETQGVDLSRALAGAAEPPTISPYSESLHGELEFAMAPLHGVRSGPWTYIRAPRAELYDRSDDPGETRNLLDPSVAEAASASPKVAAQQAAKLDRALSEILQESKRFDFTETTSPLDAQTVQMLRALGYMGEPGANAGLEGMDPKDGVRAFDDLDRARQLAFEERYVEAKQVLTSLLDWVPKNASARNLLAMCEFRLANPGAAKQHYLRSLADEPRQPEVLVQLGRIELAEEQQEAARVRFSDALEVDASHVEAMILLAYLDLREGRQEDAKAWYDKAIAADPSYPDPYLHYGDLYFRLGDFQAAEGWYERALDADPESYRGAAQAGTCALQLGDPKRAERYFLRASQAKPGSWQPMYNLACARALQGDKSSGVDYLEKAVARGLTDVALLERSKCMETLRGEPRVEALIRDMGAR